MRKLKLEIESLAVESFDTSVGAKGTRGTVHGRSALCWPEYSYDPDTCAGAGDEPSLATCNGASCPKTACGTCDCDTKNNCTGPGCYMTVATWFNCGGGNTACCGSLPTN